jgi:hypothetical protein
MTVFTPPPLQVATVSDAEQLTTVKLLAADACDAVITNAATSAAMSASARSDKRLTNRFLPMVPPHLAR